MTTKKLTSIIYRLTADEGMWLTCYTDDMDITTYASYTCVATTKGRIKYYREITDAENTEYLERKAIALAAMEEESDEDEDGEYSEDEE